MWLWSHEGTSSFVCSLESHDIDTKDIWLEGNYNLFDEVLFKKIGKKI